MSKLYTSEYNPREITLGWDDDEPSPEAVKPVEHGWAGETVAGLARGTLGVIGAPASLADVAGEAIGWKGLEKAGEAVAGGIQKKIDTTPWLTKSASISGDIRDNPQLWTDPRWYLSLVSEGAPTIASMIIPGMAAGKIATGAGLGLKAVQTARTGGALVAGMGLEGGGAAEDIRQYEERTGEHVPIGKKLQTVAGTGIVAGSFEAIPIFNLFGAKAAKHLIARVITSMSLEGGTEGAQEIVANAFAKAGYDADTDMIGGVIESVIGGALLGGGMGMMQETFQERLNNTDADKVAKLLEQAEKEAEVPGGDQTTKQQRQKFKNIIIDGIQTGVDPNGDFWTQENLIATVKVGIEQGMFDKTDLAEIKETKGISNELVNSIAMVQIESQTDEAAAPPVTPTITVVPKLEETEPVILPVVPVVEPTEDVPLSLAQLEDKEFEAWGQKAAKSYTEQEEADIDAYVEAETARRLNKEESESFNDWKKKAGREVYYEPGVESEEETQARIGFEGRASYLRQYIDQLTTGEPGFRKKIVDYDGATHWEGFSSSFPEWFQNQGWGSKQAIKALEKGLAGGKFKESGGKGQGDIWEAALAAAELERDRGLIAYSEAIEKDPERIGGMPMDEYQLMLEVLRNEGFYTGTVETAAASFRQEIEREAVSATSKELGITEEELTSILADEAQPDIDLGQAWQDISDEDQVFVDQWNRERLEKGKGKDKAEEVVETVDEDTSEIVPEKPSGEMEPEPKTAQDLEDESILDKKLWETRFKDVAGRFKKDIHKEAVEQAIEQGKIESHPDYPELGIKPAQKKAEDVAEVKAPSESISKPSIEIKPDFSKMPLDSITVKVSGYNEAGQVIKVKESAKEALENIEKEIEQYKAILKCL